MNPVIGVVAHRTGRLAALGTPLCHAADAYRRDAGGRAFDVSIRDSGSSPAGARDAVARLIDHDGATLIVTLGGTHTVPAVAAASTEAGLPCLSTTLPWQVWRAAVAPGPSFHACWGLDDIAAAFAAAWSRVPGAHRVGCLWNSGPQGRALRAPDAGFAAQAAARGLDLVDPGGYPEDATDFRHEVAEFAAREVRIVTSAATATDLRVFHDQAIAQGLDLDLITCSRWLSYPVGARESGVDGVATAVYWTPRHPFTSSINGRTCAELATDYETANDAPWLQPLGMAYALFEVADAALRTTAPTDVATELARTRLTTIAGPLDWTTGPAEGVARVPLATGQWQADQLRVIANDRVPEVAVEADLGLPSRTTRNR